MVVAPDVAVVAAGTAVVADAIVPAEVLGADVAVAAFWATVAAWPAGAAAAFATASACSLTPPWLAVCGGAANGVTCAAAAAAPA